jgi:hypothetical protein
MGEGGPRRSGGTSVAGAQVVAGQQVAVAQVQAAVVDDRMRPGRSAAFDGFEGALDPQRFGRGFDQCQRAAVVAEDQVAVGVDDGGGTGGRSALFPLISPVASFRQTGLPLFWPSPP